MKDPDFVLMNLRAITYVYLPDRPPCLYPIAVAISISQSSFKLFRMSAPKPCKVESLGEAVNLAIALWGGSIGSSSHLRLLLLHVGLSRRVHHLDGISLGGSFWIALPGIMIIGF